MRRLQASYAIAVSLSLVCFTGCTRTAAVSVPPAQLSAAAARTTRVPSNWPVFGHDPARSGVDSGDAILTKANVSTLVAKWQINLGAVADSTPILLASVKIGTSIHSVLFQTAKNGETFAVESRTGKILWHYATSGPNITTSTPAADPSGTAIYVPGVDGKVHKLDAATGQELTAPGFTLTITKMTSTEKDASALNLANGYLYAATSGYFGDAPPYIGHVVSVNLSTGVTHVFNSLCSKIKTLPGPKSCANSDSGIWSRGGAVVDPDTSMNGQIYFATGNGLFNANSGGDNYGDSVIALSEDASTFAGNYTPADYTSLQDGDTDLGSTSPALLPRQSTSSTPLMLVQGGKDSILRLINRAHLPGVGGELQEIDLPSLLYATPAVWTDPKGIAWVFVTFPQEIDAYRLQTSAQGVSSLVHVWTSTAGSTGGEGTSPVVSNGMVFVAMDNALLALDAFTGALLWSSANASAVHTIGPVHWESPIVANGWLYCSDENGNLTAYGLP
jgi:outer membrane protein assembly factor BamB